jgi:hypothetical protein
MYSLQIRGYIDLSLYSGAALTFMFIIIILMTTPYQAQAQTSPLTEDQDGDGDPLNEESGIRFSCSVDQDLIRGLASQFGIESKVHLTLSEDDCNYVMQYLSGQCEEQTAKGVNVTGVCDSTLSDYLEKRDLLTKDYPTDREQFNTIMDRFMQKRAANEQKQAAEEANTPSWAKGLDDAQNE